MINFDKIYVISLTKKRPNKISDFMLSVPKDWGFGKIDVYDAIDGSTQELPLWWNPALVGAYGCYKSHLNILQEIVDNDWNQTLILEDDAIFSDNFLSQLPITMSHLPGDWEQMYLGGQHLSKAIKINDYICKAININRTHCYIIKNKIVAQKIINLFIDKDFWIKNLTKYKYHIDYAYGILHKQNIIKTYASNPFLVGQKANNISDTGSQISRLDRWWNR